MKGAFATDPLGHTYYAAKSGVLYRGLRKIGKRYYYFDRSSHAMQTGWVKTSRGTYYMKGAGKLRGTAVTGWLRKDGLRYYFNNAGRMVTGLVRIGGRQYYFDPQSGAMATGTVTLKGKTYNFGTNGIKVKEPVTGPWSVKVNQSTCTVTVYRGSTPVKAFACSVGLNGATPDGTFRIMDHLRWHELLGPSWDSGAPILHGIFCSIRFRTQRHMTSIPWPSADITNLDRRPPMGACGWQPSMPNISMTMSQSGPRRNLPRLCEE